MPGDIRLVLSETINPEKRQVKALYISKRSLKSCGGKYLIYQDRLELHVPIFLRKFIIPFSEIISVEIFKPPVCRTALWALKLDWADLCTHVGITRKTGWFKQLRFTPDNPAEFVNRLNASLEHRSSTG